MSHHAQEILCVTARLNDDILYIQMDENKYALVVARDDQQMTELLTEIKKFTSIDLDAVQLCHNPESDILLHFQNSPDLNRAVFLLDNQMTSIDRDTILSNGISPFLYYKSAAEPIYYTAEATSEPMFFLAYNEEQPSTVAFVGFDNLLLIAQTEEQMSEIASSVYADSPYNFQSVEQLTCEQLPESQLLSIINQMKIDGILFIDAKQEPSIVLKENILQVGLQTCFAPN